MSHVLRKHMEDKTARPDAEEPLDPGFWYKPTRAGLTIADDHRTTPHPRAGHTTPVRPPAGELAAARPGEAVPDGWTRIDRETAQDQFGQNFITALLPRPDNTKRPAHEVQLTEKASRLLEAFIAGCRQESSDQYWTPSRNDNAAQVEQPTRIALAVRTDACAHPSIAPRPSSVRIIDQETGTAVEVEALGEIPARVHARTTTEAPWRLINYHHDDLSAAIAQVVDPSYGHRTLPAKIEVLEAMAQFVENGGESEARAEAEVATAEGSTNTTTTVDAESAVLLLAKTIHLTRAAYGRPGWTVDAIKENGARIIIHGRANETPEDRTAGAWHQSPHQEEHSQEAIVAHQQMRRKVQALIDTVIERVVPLWDGGAYQERLTGFRPLKNSDDEQLRQP